MSGASARIGDRVVEQGGPVYVIAEAGVNHNGDVRLAHDLVDVAAQCGADAVKFQTFDPAQLVAASAAATPYQQQRGAVDQRSLLDALTLPERAWSELQQHAQDAGIAFLSTPFDLGSARLLAGLGLPAMKVSSGELTNLPMLRELSELGLTLLVSTGMGDADEVAAAVGACQAAPGLILFHCVSSYPAPDDQCNLRAIAALSQAHQVPVGWSDHTVGATTAVAAVALGAPILEKHITTDCTLPGPDHPASMEPADFAGYVQAVHATRAALGDGVKRRMPAEVENAVLVRRSWHAATDLAVGATIAPADVVALRPEGGLPPGVELVGRRVRMALATGDPVTDAALDPIATDHTQIDTNDPRQARA